MVGCILAKFPFAKSVSTAVYRIGGCARAAGASASADPFSTRLYLLGPGKLGSGEATTALGIEAEGGGDATGATTAGAAGVTEGTVEGGGGKSGKAGGTDLLSLNSKS